MKTYTYRVRHKVTGRTYYGMTNNVEARWRYHKMGDNGCRYFSAAIQCHGADAFEWVVLSEFPTRKAAAMDEVRLLTEAERCGEPLYNLRLPSSKQGVGNYKNFAWGKKTPWLDTSPDSRTIQDADMELDEAQMSADESDFGLGIDPTWND